MKALVMYLCATIALGVHAHHFDPPSSRPDDITADEFCEYALIAVNLGCSPLLDKVIVDRPRLNVDQLSGFCTPGCRESTRSYRGRLW